MIADNLNQLNRRIEQLKICNKLIMKAVRRSSTILNNNLLSSPFFSSSSYIRDIKSDISNCVSKIALDHIFSDGNKRTALLMLVHLSLEYNLELKDTDDIWVDINDLVTHKISEEEFKNRVFK